MQRQVHRLSARLINREGEQMAHELDERYGLPAEDPQVAEAVSLMESLPEPERARFLQALASAVYAYQRTSDPNGLLNFASDFTATVRLRTRPGYAEALAAAPTRAMGPGVGVKELFEQARR